ncbi:MAG: penicillin-binding protein [Anaerolineales bacterium]|nr:penicillin-binding protein [Anaerolineales bacterium]MCB8951099.1 penicillin-binding protein [Ardenticatenales bacterium]
MGNYEFKYLRPYQPPPPPEKPARRLPGCLRLLLFLFQWGLVGIILAGLLFFGSYIYFSRQLAGTIQQIVNYQGSGVGGTPRIFDRNGTLLYEQPPVEKRSWLTYEQLPDALKNATIAVEDDTFWRNPGFDPPAIVAAIISNLRHQEGRPVGASTITQQLVRHIAFSYEERVTPSYQRKALEIFYAFILTQQRSKQDILTMYLNEIYYGNLAYGAAAAAQTYFGKSAADLTLAEATFLAGLPQAPLDWDPYTNFDGAKARQENILDLMVEERFIDAPTAEAEKARSLSLAPLIPVAQRAAATHLDTPHFVLYVQQELERRYGPDAFTRNGWQVTTSLDLNIQRLAETAAREVVAARAAAHDVRNAAVVVLKPATGEILSMVGSLDYFDEAIDGQFNMTLQARQPGSSFKPITYAAAMQRGWTTGDVLWDVPIVLDLGGGQTMQPRNYDGRYHGPLLLRDALANSYNIPPIQLARDVGLPAVIGMAQTLGVASLRQPPGYYGLALTLGGGEVPLLELTQAYATLANQGRRPRLVSVLRIVDSFGNVIYDQQRDRVPASNALDPRIAYILTDILSDNRARTPAMGANSPLRLPFPAAVKTGTTNDYRDNWTMGYTPGLVVGVWSGNTDNHPMRDTSGLSGAAPIWNRIMQGVYADEQMRRQLAVNGQMPPTEFPRPNGIEERAVCLPAGTGGSVCAASRPDLFLIGEAVHAVARLGYAPDVTSNPGAWTLVTAGMDAAGAQSVWQSQPALTDGARPPLPSTCVVTGSRSAGSAAARLLLPVPPFYPDEVRARLWARGSGYQMAPATACPVGVARANVSGGSGGSDSSRVDHGGGTSDSASYVITSPLPGQQVRGPVSIWGSAMFNSAQVQYYKLEIGRGANPTAWVTFGSTHTQPVSDGVLEVLYAGEMPAGDYVIRLVLVGWDGNFHNPYQVPIQIAP